MGHVIILKITKVKPVELQVQKFWIEESAENLNGRNGEQFSAANGTSERMDILIILIL